MNLNGILKLKKKGRVSFLALPVLLGGGCQALLLQTCLLALSMQTSLSVREEKIHVITEKTIW